MSTVLFLSTDNKISENIRKQIKTICKQKKADMEFLPYGKYDGIIGENYFVDSMWTPCRFPLKTFTNAEKYFDFVHIYEAVKEILKLLIENDYPVSLFLNSVGEDKKELVGMGILPISEINENLSLEYAKIYKLVV